MDRVPEPICLMKQTMPQVKNAQLVQPKSTALYSLAREIPAHRQEKLAGRRRVGPIRNIAPYWSNINAPSAFLVDLQAPIVYPKSVTLELPNDPIEEEIRQLKNKLLEKERQLETSAQTKEKQKNELSQLTTAKDTAEAVARNLRQQLINMTSDSKDILQTSNLSARLREKEEEATQLKQELAKLRDESAGQQESLRREVETYRRQIRELAREQQRLNQRVSGEQQKGELRVAEPKYQQMLEKVMETPAQTQPARPQKVKPASVAREAARTPVLTDAKNSITGLVKDSLGRQVSNAVVIIKDKSNHSLRALKSNQLGQFVMTTPLPNGEYLIEIEKSGLTFDLTSIYLTGEKVPMIEITSHESLT